MFYAGLVLTAVAFVVLSRIVSLRYVLGLAALMALFFVGEAAMLHYRRVATGAAYEAAATQKAVAVTEAKRADSATSTLEFAVAKAIGTGNLREAIISGQIAVDMAVFEQAAYRRLAKKAGCMESLPSDDLIIAASQRLQAAKSDWLKAAADEQSAAVVPAPATPVPQRPQIGGFHGHVQQDAGSQDGRPAVRYGHGQMPVDTNDPRPNSEIIGFGPQGFIIGVRPR